MSGTDVYPPQKRSAVMRRVKGKDTAPELAVRKALTAAFDVASRDDMAGKLIVTIIPSFAERYISTALFDGL